MCAPSCLCLRKSYEGVMSHSCMNHVTRMNASCHTQECIMSHIWMRGNVRAQLSICEDSHAWVMPHSCMHHGKHMNESCLTHDKSCHTYEWVMSHVWISHVTHINDSCHTYECILSHTGMSHVTRMHGSSHVYKYVRMRGCTRLPLYY